jgi:hypothetical protein
MYRTLCHTIILKVRVAKVSTAKTKRSLTKKTGSQMAKTGLRNRKTQTKIVKTERRRRGADLGRRTLEDEVNAHSIILKQLLGTLVACLP